MNSYGPSEFLSPFAVIIDNQNDKSSEPAFQIQPYIKRPKMYYLFHVSFGFLQFILL